jgi:hypothetical protein
LAVAAPAESSELEPESALVLCQRRQHLLSGGYNLFPDAITGNRGDSISLHVVLLRSYGNHSYAKGASGSDAIYPIRF